MIRLDIDHLVATVTYLDQKKLIDRLLIFVTADPDLILCARLLEVDMFAKVNMPKKYSNDALCCSPNERASGQ